MSRPTLEYASPEPLEPRRQKAWAAVAMVAAAWVNLNGLAIAFGWDDLTFTVLAAIGINALLLLVGGVLSASIFRAASTAAFIAYLSVAVLLPTVTISLAMWVMLS